MAGEVESGTLSAQLCVARRGAGKPAFILDVSVQFPAGITIVFGSSGAGKSTLLDCVAGLLRPDSGKVTSGDRVLFDSATGVNLMPQERRVAYVFQSLALFPHMSVVDNIAYGLADMLPARRAERIDTVLGAFRVAHLRARRPGEISGGEQQRVALARSLVTMPQVLLLDEPLSGLDAQLKASIVEDLRAWNRMQRIPILYVTHSREETDALGERVTAIENGRVIGEGRPRDVLDAPRRTALAQTAGFENLLDAMVVNLREADGVMRVRLANSSSEIEVPLGYGQPGERVRIAIRAGDILLATHIPGGLSARNIQEGQIESVDQQGTVVAVRVNCGGVTFVSHITPGAARTLQLGSGKTVWIVLKTHSCHLVSA